MILRFARTHCSGQKWTTWRTRCLYQSCDESIVWIDVIKNPWSEELVSDGSEESLTWDVEYLLYGPRYEDWRPICLDMWYGELFVQICDMKNTFLASDMRNSVSEIMIYSSLCQVDNSKDPCSCKGVRSARRWLINWQSSFPVGVV